eukprot:scaffold2031_cov112-Isochrysis_galbana.AAC.2
MSTGSGCRGPVEVIRGVRVGSISAARYHSAGVLNLLGHDGNPTEHPLPKFIESLRGIKLNAVAAGKQHTLALADDGSGVRLGQLVCSSIGCARPGSDSGAGSAEKRAHPAAYSGTVCAASVTRNVWLTHRRGALLALATGACMLATCRSPPCSTSALALIIFVSA